MREMGAEGAIGKGARRDKAAAKAAADADAKPQLDALIARYDAFRTRITTADLSGGIPLVKAAILDRMVREPMLLLRVHVEKAGGSLVNRTNLWSWLGRDPVRISGGLVVSYTIVDPSDGSVRKADVLARGSRAAKISAIQQSFAPKTPAVSGAG